MEESIVKNIRLIQDRIQNLNGNSVNANMLKKLIEEAGQTINEIYPDYSKQLAMLGKELNFYTNEGDDSHQRYFNCKAESLTALSKILQLLNTDAD